jgi:hypothetical protein
MPSSENLHVTCTQIKRFYPVTVPVENLADVIEAFTASASDVGDIFKQTTLISLLHQDRYSKIVGVEVPGKNCLGSKIFDVNPASGSA